MSDTVDPVPPTPSDAAPAPPPKTITVLMEPFVALILSPTGADPWGKVPWTCRLPSGAIRRVDPVPGTRICHVPPVCWAESWDEPGAKAYAAYARAPLGTDFFLGARAGHTDAGAPMPTWEELLREAKTGDHVARRTLQRWRTFAATQPALPKVGMRFGQAQQWLEEGERAYRPGWGERGGHIAMRRTGVVDGQPVRVHTYHEDAQGVQTPWVPTQEDMYAKDWAVLLRANAPFSD